MYLVSFNLLVFVDFNYKYTLLNVYDNNFNRFSDLLAAVLYISISLAEFGLIYYLYQISVSLKNRKRSNKIIYFFYLVGLLYGVCSVIGLTLYYLKSTEKWLYIVHMIWILTFILIIFLIIISIYRAAKVEADQKRRVLLNRFALILIPGYLLFSISNIDFYFFGLNIGNIDPLVFLLINISPFIWLRSPSINYLFQKVPSSVPTDAFRRVIIDFNISGRESEIIRLIIEGKSNKDIEQKLNISFNTVKNHVYNLYRKLGVNSRSQMIRFISQYGHSQTD